MEQQPMNTAEQKDMTEFFTDLITKIEEMSPTLKQMVQRLFCGVISNNVVSENCPHVSKTTEAFYTVRCQVADMKDLYASLGTFTNHAIKIKQKYSFNDADVKDWDSSNLASECFGGELTRPQYDSAADKFLDLSFEKANSAYMVFYQRIPVASENVDKIAQKKKSGEDVVKLSDDLARWIWEDNVQFIQDLMIFDHQYHQFVWLFCSQILHSLVEKSPSEQTYLGAKLALRFVFETLIHAKEKPTIGGWTELLMKLLSASQTACEWFLEEMIKDNTWPFELLFKCPVNSCRELFEKLTSHVFIALHSKHEQYFLCGIGSKTPFESVEADQVGQKSCITRFIHVLLNLVATSSSSIEVRQMTEFFSLLLNFASGGQTAKKFLLAAGTIRTLIDFYMSRVAQEMAELSEDESDESDVGGLLSLVRSACISRSLWLSPALERMINLVIVLLEASRGSTGGFILHKDDRTAVYGTKNYSFLMQQIKDAANVKVASLLIVSVCKNNQMLKQKLVETICSNIQKLNREDISPYFSVLSELCSVDDGDVRGSGEKGFLELTLNHIWNLAQRKPVPCLNWLEQNACTCPRLYAYLLDNLNSWVERYLLGSPNSQARAAAGQLLLSLVPSSSVRQAYIQYHNRSSSTLQPKVQGVSADAVSTLHKVYEFLLNLMPRASIYADTEQYSQSRLVFYFHAMRACLIGKDEKRMLIPFLNNLWTTYRKYMHGPSPTKNPIKIYPNKQALMTFWYCASLDCPEVVQASMKIDDIINQMFFCYIVIENDRDTISYNKQFLPAFYGLVKMFCECSPKFCEVIMTHVNLKFCITSVATRTSEFRQASEDIVSILELCCRVKNPTKVREFKRVVWTHMEEVMAASRTHFVLLVKVIRFLAESPEEKLFLLENNVLNVLSDVLVTVHEMYHEATACHVVGDLCEILKKIQDFLARLEQCKSVKEAWSDNILGDWSKAKLVGCKLMRLLNSYVPHELRRLSIECLKLMIKLLESDVELIDELVNIVITAHKKWDNNCGLSSNVGPYFPKRGQNTDITLKVHPPSPALDMCLHPMQLEASKGVDSAYDQQLNDYFSPYHSLVDMIIRSAINVEKDQFQTKSLLAFISAHVGYEGIPLHLALFPKLWLDIKNRNKEGRDVQWLLDDLYQTEKLHEYLNTVLSQEQSSLCNTIIYDFVKEFLPGSISSEVKFNIVENAQDCLKSAASTWDADSASRMQLVCNKIFGIMRIMGLTLKHVGAEILKQSKICDYVGEILERICESLQSETVAPELRNSLTDCRDLIIETRKSLNEILQESLSPQDNGGD